MIDKTLRSHIKKCGELKAQIDALTALFNAEKETITSELKSRNTSDYSGGGYAVKYIEYARKHLNNNKLKADYPALFAKYTEETPANRFTVASI